ncbi:2'-5' RNA ligase family protein [Ornithinimicrobium sufpigmenti]|uniref:2'-5' RNA ligase family protein n=1 Tax=Ornithinimicrobium sufpigmenti TaxID=2508882 RepID=UPI00192D42CD|nr:MULTISPECIES: 2'-5' RNA ligase family protein [unclassified Ornithinimicrobium]
MTSEDPTTFRDVVIGVAIPVPEPWGEHLRQLRVDYGDTRAQHIPTHITLLPPTATTSAAMDGVRAHLSQVAARHTPFEVILRGTGTFRPVSDVVYVQVAQGVASCEQLERDVRSGPLGRELSFPYHPHVTLAHDLPHSVLDRVFADLAGFSCTFQVEAFRLYGHRGDELWSPLQDFPMGAARG